MTVDPENPRNGRPGRWIEFRNQIIPEIPWGDWGIGQSMGPHSPKREDGFRSGLGMSILGILFHIVGKD